MKTQVLRLLVTVVSILICFSCGKHEQTSATSGDQTTNKSDTAGAFTAGSQKEDAVIATVNGSEITEKELQQETQSLLAQYQNRISPEQLKEMLPTIRQQALEGTINKELLLQEAVGKNIAPSGEEIDMELKSIVSRFETHELFQQQLVASGMSEEALRSDIERSLTISAVMKAALSGIPDTNEGEVSAFYAENPDSFKVPEEIRASHILLKLSPETSKEEKNSKRMELAGINGLIEQGADFAELASAHSECPSSQQGGDLGFFSRGKMVKPFEDAAFGLKKGEISDIVETQFGYHLIKVVDRREARTVPLDEVKDQIAAHLKSRKENEAMGEHLKKLRQSATIQYATKIR
jgi:peptidyl-prolyl cis-trans isomerase C